MDPSASWRRTPCHQTMQQGLKGTDPLRLICLDERAFFPHHLTVFFPASAARKKLGLQLGLRTTRRDDNQAVTSSNNERNRKAGECG